jgi:hypothetical protein
MRLQFLFLFSLLSFSIEAQVKVTSIQLRGSNSSWLSYSFPLIQHSNKIVAKKINSYLQKEILDNSRIETEVNKIFENCRYINNDSIHQSGYSEINFSVEVNNSRLLSITFQMESTGAYSENYPLYYNFDLQTGDIIDIKKLFSATSIAQIKKGLIDERKKRIEDAIKEIRQNYSDSAFREDSSWIYETYAECNKETEEQNILIKKNSILFYKEYCFPHVARPFDTDLDIELSFLNLQRYFTLSTKSLLLKSKRSTKK